MRYKKKRHNNYALSIGVFVIIFALFYFGIESFSEGSAERQAESLRVALNRGITYCYATDGAYPESLDALRERYTIAYDEERFFVDYRVIASNIYPDVTIIERGSLQ